MFNKKQGALKCTEKEKHFLTCVLYATVFNSNLTENTPSGSGKPEHWSALQPGGT